MSKYKINYIFDSKANINNIIIDVLNKELKKYINAFYKIKKI